MNPPSSTASASAGSALKEGAQIARAPYNRTTSPLEEEGRASLGYMQNPAFRQVVIDNVPFAMPRVEDLETRPPIRSAARFILWLAGLASRPHRRR